ncbi:spore germination protein [Neobacillus sp. D3-1R]|uniref:spore germination protein n=1 Tax=Neobacillus sp. D3-1R TaxID=3445778 RepID=UPI003F9FE95F
MKIPFFHKEKDNKKEKPPQPEDQAEFSGNFEIDKCILMKRYAYPDNKDFMVREFTLYPLRKKGALFYVPSISNSNIIDEEILKPLIMGDKAVRDIPSLLTGSAVKEEKVISNAIKEINAGDTVLFLEGEKAPYIIKTAEVAGRNVEKPQNETTLMGPKEAFNEKAETNISLIRKRIRTEDFMVEKMVIGKRSFNEVYLVYNRELVGEQVLAEVKQRIGAIEKDAVQNLSLLTQYIEDRNSSLLPTILETERPDRAASFIEDGYITVLMNNSPSSLILPATFWSFYHSADDHYLRFFYGNFTRVLRMIAMFITLFIPSIYIAITNYHVEMIPTDLLLAIAGAREQVPFPAIVELLIMELSFELIREAGVRVPTPIGPTIGIVGALILGQAAVEANIVSPIVVIVVALTGLSSFAIGDINLNYAIRIARFIFLLASSLFGIFGMVGCFILVLAYLTVIKSFGVPYLAPLTPNYRSSNDTIFRKVLISENLRPAYVKTKDITKDTDENGE